MCYQSLADSAHYVLSKHTARASSVNNKNSDDPTNHNNNHAVNNVTDTEKDQRQTIETVCVLCFPSHDLDLRWRRPMQPSWRWSSWNTLGLRRSCNARGASANILGSSVLMARASHHWQRPELRVTTAGRSSLKATASDWKSLWPIKPKGFLVFLEIWQSRVSSTSRLEDSCTDLVEEPEQQH